MLYDRPRPSHPAMALVIRLDRLFPPTRWHWRLGSQSDIPVHLVLSTTVLGRCLWSSMSLWVVGSISAAVIEDGYVVSRIVTCTPPMDPRIRRASIQTDCAWQCHLIAQTCCQYRILCPEHPLCHFHLDLFPHRGGFIHCPDCHVSLLKFLLRRKQSQRSCGGTGS